MCPLSIDLLVMSLQQPASGRSLDEIVHHDHYEQDKFMSNERVIQFLYELRGKTLQTYRQSYVGKDESSKE